MTTCKQCGKREVEPQRECYATPVCYACLPPPEPLPIVRHKVKVKSHESMWQFWLDDACYRVARGARYLDIPSEVSREFWKAIIEPKINEIQNTHGVLIRAVGDTEGVEIQVAKYGWVFKLMDYGKYNGGELEDLITGLLLGYDASEIDGFVSKKYEEQP